MTLSLTVCGAHSGGIPTGSAYLVEHGATRLLVECGNGALREVVARAPLRSLAGVFVSHLHADHAGDLIALALDARYSGRKLPLYGPEGLRTLLYRWFSLFHATPDAYVEAFAIRELAPWESFDVGELRCQAMPVEHNVPCFGVRVEPRAGGPRMFFTGDTKESALAVEAAQGADLLLAEATFQDLLPDRKPEASRAHHMTAREAGRLARDAGAKRLLLTHLLYTLDPDASVAQAREEVDGPVEVARVGARYEVSRD